MADQGDETPMHKWIVLFRNGSGAGCEAVDPAAAIVLAKVMPEG